MSEAILFSNQTWIKFCRKQIEWKVFIQSPDKKGPKLQFVINWYPHFCSKNQRMFCNTNGNFPSDFNRFVVECVHVTWNDVYWATLWIYRNVKIKMAISRLCEWNGENLATAAATKTAATEQLTSCWMNGLVYPYTSLISVRTWAWSSGVYIHTLSKYFKSRCQIDVHT